MAYCGPRGIALDEFLRWPKSSQDAALAWAEHEARRCRHCGTHPDDWSENRLAHHAHLTQCKGCQESQRLAESPQAKEGRGIYVTLAPGSAGVCPRCAPDDDPDEFDDPTS